MKTRTGLAGILGLMILAGILIGCVTNRNSTGQVISYTFLGQTIYPTNAYLVVKTLATSGANIGVNKGGTNAAAYLGLLYDAVDGALADTNFNPADVVAQIGSINANHLESIDPVAIAALEAVLVEVSTLLSGQTASASNPFIVPVLEGFRDGIGQAIGRGKAPPQSRGRSGGPALAALPLGLWRTRKPKGKRVLQTSISLLFLCLLAGCVTLSGCTLNQVYPKTEITGYVGGKPFTFQAPKDYDVKGFDAAVDTNGAIHLHVDSLVSSLSVSNVNAVANGQAAIVTATGVQIINGINAGAALAGTAAKAAVGAP